MIKLEDFLARNAKILKTVTNIAFWTDFVY